MKNTARAIAVVISLSLIMGLTALVTNEEVTPPTPRSDAGPCDACNPGWYACGRCKCCPPGIPQPRVPRPTQ